MEVFMKKLLLALIVLATVFSCGKSNSTSNSSVSSLSVTGTNETALGSYITSYSSSFGNGYANAYTTWTSLISSQPNTTYYYYKSTQATSTCTTKWSIFYVCSTSSSSSSSYLSKSVVNSSVDITTKQNELIGIINSRSSIYVSGTSYYIYTSDAKIYVIDTRYPIQANPVLIQDNTAKTIEVFSYAL